MTDWLNTLLLFLLKYFLLFAAGSLAGYIIELFWRRYFGKARRWINPGFLNGPWLPLYGFGFIFLYLLSLPAWTLAVRIPVFFISLTVLELIAGVVFIEHFKIKLWDYSRSWGNFRGLICPLYSVFWTLLGLFFFSVIYPHLEDMINTLYGQLQLSFFIGLYGGLFSADVWLSFDLARKIRRYVRETEGKMAVDFEKLKLEIRDRLPAGRLQRVPFFLPFHGSMGMALRDRLRDHISRRPRPAQTLERLKNRRPRSK